LKVNMLSALAFLIVFNISPSAMAQVIVPGGAVPTSSAQPTVTCGQQCATVNLQAAGNANAPWSSSCMCLQANQGSGNQQQQQQPQQQQPPPQQPQQNPVDNSKNQQAKGGDDECSKEGASADSLGRRSCQELEDHTKNACNSSSSEDMPDAAAYQTAMNTAQAAQQATAGQGSNQQAQANNQIPAMQNMQASNEMKGQQCQRGIDRCNTSCEKEIKCRDKKIQQLQARVSSGDMSAKPELQQETQKKQTAQKRPPSCNAEQGNVAKSMAKMPTSRPVKQIVFVPIALLRPTTHATLAAGASNRRSP
jgi:hypothetical protein